MQYKGMALTMDVLHVSFFSIYVFKLCASSSFVVEEITFCEQVLDHFCSCHVSAQ